MRPGYAAAIWLCRLVLLALPISLLQASSPLQVKALTVEGASMVPVTVPGEGDTQCRLGKIAAAPRCGPDGQPLQLEASPITLPAATVGKAYRYAIKPIGGTPSYQFKLQDGSLPMGMSLGEQGEISGIAISRGRLRFVVEIADQAGQRISQRYVLSVVPGKDTAEPEAPKMVPLTTLSIEEAQRPLPQSRQIEPYLITQVLFNSIEYKAPKDGGGVGGEDVASSPPAKEAGAMPEVLNEAGIGQLKSLLAPMVGVEYPNRLLFKAALEAQACRYAEQLARKTAQANQQAPQSPEQWQRQCPGAWQRATQEKTVVEASAPVPWQDLAATLLPLEWRDWVIEKSVEYPDPKIRPYPLWTASGCNCLVSATNGEVYAYFPSWHTSPPQAGVDFSLYERIIAFGSPFDEDGNVRAFTPSDKELEFLRTVHTYGSKLDLAIYRNDWRFLRDLPDDHQDRIALQVAQQATRLVDKPLADYGERWHDWVPGIASDERVGDGITLYLDDLPSADPVLRRAFERFRDRLIKALIVELRKSKREYTLNLMVNDYDFVKWAKVAETTATAGKTKVDGKRKPTAESDEATWSPWSIDTLFDYLILAEDPRIENKRVVAKEGRHTSRTNVTLRYVVLLSEPTKVSRKSLRDFVEASPLLIVENRRTFLQKIFPLVSVGSATPEQFSDDMTNFTANFGGVALWPQPASPDESKQVRQGEIKQAEPDDAKDGVQSKAKVYEAMAQSIRTTFLANEPKESAICGAVCNLRWPLRAAFVVLMIVSVISIAAYFLSCRVRARGRPYQIYMVLGCLPPVIIGGLLQQCDPDLINLRNNSTILFIVIGFLVVSSIVPLLLPKIEKP